MPRTRRPRAGQRGRSAWRRRPGLRVPYFTVKIKGNKLEPLFALLRTNERGGFLTLARCHPGRRRLTRPAGKAAAGLTPSSGGSGQARPLGPHPEDLSSVTNSGSRGGRVPQIRVSHDRIWGPRVWVWLLCVGGRRPALGRRQRLRLTWKTLAAAVVSMVQRRRRQTWRGAWKLRPAWCWRWRRPRAGSARPS